MQRLTDALDFQAQALVLRSERQRLIASNIANADTPGYVARDMDFARALREATGQVQTMAAAQTQPQHIASSAGARDESNLLYTRPAEDNLDRKTVDLDRKLCRALPSHPPLVQPMAPPQTHPQHIATSPGPRPDPNLLYTRPSQDNLDRNTVDMDRERAAFADNTVKYEAALRFINAQ